jgi:hypothetical protein
VFDGREGWEGATKANGMPLRLITACAVVASLGQIACYDSASPIDPTPGVNVDAALLGAWRCVPEGGKVSDEAATMTVAQLQPRVYRVVFDGDDYEGYSSEVNGTTIANLKTLKSGQAKPWSFVRYSFLRPRVLHLEVIADKAIDDDHPPPSLRKGLEGLSSSGYEDFAVCVRAAEK